MQLVSLEKSRSTQLFYLVAGLLAAVFLLTAKQDDPGVVAAGVIVAIASIYPLYFWLLGWSHGFRSSRGDGGFRGFIGSSGLRVWRTDCGAVG